MKDAVVNLMDYRAMKGNQNVKLSRNGDKQIPEELKKIFEDLNLDAYTYNSYNYLHNEELSASKDNEEGDYMSENGYVTEKDLKALEDRLDQKINFNQQILIQKLDSTKSEINLKLENQMLGFKNIIDSKFSEQKEKQTTNNRFIISTIIATAGVLFAALKLFLK